MNAHDALTEAMKACATIYSDLRKTKPGIMYHQGWDDAADLCEGAILALRNALHATIDGRNAGNGFEQWWENACLHPMMKPACAAAWKAAAQHGPSREPCVGDDYEIVK